MKDVRYAPGSPPRLIEHVVGYASAPPVAQAGFPSLRDQTLLIEQVCQENGWELTNTRTDRLVLPEQGLNDRPGLRHVLKDLAAVEAVVAYSSSCLGEAFVPFTDRARASGVRFLSITEPDLNRSPDDYDGDGHIRRALLSEWLSAREEREKRLSRPWIGKFSGDIGSILAITVTAGGLRWAIMWLGAVGGASLSTVVALSHWMMLAVCCAGTAGILAREQRGATIRQLHSAPSAGSLGGEVLRTFSAVLCLGLGLALIAEGFYQLIHWLTS